MNDASTFIHHITNPPHPHPPVGEGFSPPVGGDALFVGTLRSPYPSRVFGKLVDEAVFAAYGWKPDLADEEILERATRQ